MEEVALNRKYKKFRALCEGGCSITITAPQSKVTLGTALKYASHWIKMQNGLTLKVYSVIGIE